MVHGAEWVAPTEVDSPCSISAFRCSSLAMPSGVLQDLTRLSTEVEARAGPALQPKDTSGSAWRAPRMTRCTDSRFGRDFDGLPGEPGDLSISPPRRRQGRS